MIPKLYEIVRYGGGSSALMRVTRIQSDGYIYGTQFYGGVVSRRDISYATDEDKIRFKKQELFNAQNKGFESFEQFVRIVGEWAEATFPQSTEQSILSHLKEEVDELTAVTVGGAHGRIMKSFEVADVLLLVAHFCYKNKIEPNQAAYLKHALNMQREWETEPNENGYFKHKEG